MQSTACVESLFCDRVYPCATHIRQTQRVHQLTAIGQRLREMEARIEKYHLRVRLDEAHHMQKHCAVGSEARYECGIAHEAISR